MVLESSEDGNKAVGEKQGDTPCSRFFFLFAESEQNRTNGKDRDSKTSWATFVVYC